MRLEQRIRPITQLKNNAAELIRDVAASRQPLVITQNGEARAVLMDVATYDSWREALLMLKLVAQGEADVAAGKVIPNELVFAELSADLSPHDRNDG